MTPNTPRRPWYPRSTPLKSVMGILDTLSAGPRKALVTLCRAQQLPSPKDKILVARTLPILSYIFIDFSPTEFIDPLPLTDFGRAVLTYITSPVLTGLLLVLCLDVPDSYDTDTLALASWEKEFRATQTIRQPSEWDWDMLLGNVRVNWNGPGPHAYFSNLSPLQIRFRKRLDSYRRRIHQRVVLPHYTRRGVSSETGEWILSNRSARVVKHGSRRSFCRHLNPRNITSLDVVHYFIRTGHWPPGRVEMRQQWKPNLLVPRTYFAWGGSAVRASTYLRNFFNELADLYPPAHRLNRVQPDWLRFQTRSPSEFFIFYDLTSFTSWFHEQTPLLRAIARAFRDVMFYPVVDGLTLAYESIGDMVDTYIDEVNDFTEFYFRYTPLGWVEEYITFAHECAGFLGVPGNLVTCTLGHGLAIGSVCSGDRSQQDAGDDEGVAVRDDIHRLDVVATAQTLGLLQDEKVYDSRQASVFLKRRVNIDSAGVSLSDMLIFPIPSTFIHPSDHYRYTRLSKTFSLPDLKTLLTRACQVLVTFNRDLWKMTKGHITDLEEELILEYLDYLHWKMGLPRGGILQGQLTNEEVDFDESLGVSEVSLKFPLHSSFLRSDPDILFSSYVNSFVVRDLSDVEILREIDGSLQPGTVVTVRCSRKWSFLRDMGYLEEIQRTAGSKVLLTGWEAKDAYLHSRRPPYSTFEVSETITSSMLSALGFQQYSSGGGSIVYDDNVKEERRVDEEYQHPLRYIDWDKPKPPPMADYGREGTPSAIYSMGNDSLPDFADLY